VLKNRPPKRLLHVYGPTESTTFASWHLVQDVPEGITTIPIGRPIANTQIYLLDDQLQPVPIGVPGEVYIGGDGLARDYLNRPELTAQRFLPNPFSEIPGERLYKTGDNARYLPNGDIEYLGRLDNLVKIRGFRIELGEIEAVLSQHPVVQESVVIAREDVPGNKRLVAYVVVNQTSGPTVGELRQFLKAKLPEYMVPSAIVLQEVLPLTPNGKVDRKALPSPQGLRPELTADYVAPQSELERTIATVWQEVLQVEKVGIHDNFFDLGGHSLLVIQVHGKLRQALDWELSVVDIFQYPTISALANYYGQQQSERPSFEHCHERAEGRKDLMKQQRQLRQKNRANNLARGS
jgi:acyl carrier protein